MKTGHSLIPLWLYMWFSVWLHLDFLFVCTAPCTGGSHQSPAHNSYIIDCYYYHTEEQWMRFEVFEVNWWSDSSERRGSCGVSRGLLRFWPSTPLKQHGSSAGGSYRQETAPVNCGTGSHLCVSITKPQTTDFHSLFQAPQLPKTP